MTFFYLLSLVFYIKARLMASSETDSGQAGMTTQGAGIGSRLTFFLISLVSAVLAMKTKENAFTLPIVIALYEFCFFPSPMTHNRSPLTRFYYLVPFLLTLLIIPLTLMSLTGAHQIDPGAYGARVYSRGQYFFTQFRVILTYLRLLFFPVNQDIDYAYPVFTSFFNLPVLLSFVFLSALFGLAVYFILFSRFTNSRCFGSTSHVSRPLSDSRPFRLMGFGILWFFITLSVESSIIPIPMLINEYRMYLPSIGMIICVVTGAFWFFSRFIKSRCFGSTSHGSRPLVSRPLIVFLVLAIGVLSVATYLRNDLWKDPIRLWEDTAKKSPGNPRAHNNLGFLYLQKKLYYSAMNECLMALRLQPNNAAAYHNLGVIYQANNMLDEAIKHYKIALAIRPDYVDTHFNLGIIYQYRKMFDYAVEQYLMALKLRPDYVDAHFNLGVIYDRDLNMPDKAIEQYLMAVQLKPDFAQAHFNLGYVYFRMGQMENARRELITGLNIKPDDRQAQQVLKTVNRES